MNILHFTESGASVHHDHTESWPDYFSVSIDDLIEFHDHRIQGISNLDRVKAELAGRKGLQSEQRRKRPVTMSAVV